MKTFYFTLLLAIITLYSGCLKDAVRTSYTFYEPVYLAKSDIRNGVKSSASQSIEKPGKIYLHGNFIYASDLGKGIHIIDYNNPSSPQNAAFIPIPGNVNFTIAGHYLYADEYSDLLTIDISKPLDARLVTVTPNAFPNAAVYSPDTSKIVVDWRRVDTVVKSREVITTPAYPVYYDYPNASLYASSTGVKSSNVSIGGSMAQFTSLNNRLYTVGNGVMNVFSIENNQSPTFIQSVPSSLGTIETIYPFENNLFLGSSNGMFIYSTENPDNPQQIGSFFHVTSCDPVIAENNKAYVTLRSGNACNGFTNQLDVLNTDSLTNPLLIKSYSLTNPRGLAKTGDYLFVCDGEQGLKIMNAADASNITLLKTVTGFEANDVIVNDGYAIVIAKDGLHIVDYNDITNAHEVATLQTGN